MEKKKILVVDDEEAIRSLLKLNLELEGYEVDTAQSAEDVLRLGPILSSYDMMLLDVMMDQIDGFELARRLRESPATAAIPLVFCTARCEPDDEVRGLEIGGEDYITKPFAMRTLAARMRRIFSRNAKTIVQPTQEKVLEAEGVRLNMATKVVTVDGEPVALTPNEWGLLHMLMAHPGRVFSRAELLSAVRGDGVVVVDRAIDVNILHLRRKLSPYGAMIATRSGFGYMLQP